MESLVLGRLPGHTTSEEEPLVRKGPSIGLILCCHHFEILNDFFNKGPHMFILHWDLSIM